MRVLLTSAFLSLAALPVLADETTGTVLAYDRVAGVIVLTDNTVWELPGDLTLPDDLVAGDVILIDFTGGGENGIADIASITRSE